jgi:hypothetical protein
MTKNSNNNDEFVRCLRCNKVIVAAEYDVHVCTPKTVNYKTMEMDYFVISKDALGRDRILVKTMNGTLYTFIKREKKASDKMPFSLPSSPH